MDIVNGVRILYSEKINDYQRQEYLNIIKSVLEDIERHENLKVDFDFLILINLKDISKWKHDGYNGMFYSSGLMIDILVGEEKDEESELISFREVLYHELRHAIFKRNVLDKNNIIHNNNNNIGINYIDEYLAYYTTYKYMSEYCENIGYDRYLRKHCYSATGILMDLSFKYSGSYNDIKKSKDKNMLINNFAKKIAIEKLMGRSKCEKEYWNNICKLPDSLDFKEINNTINKLFE